ncbi:MAG: ferredoxin [Candidatus Nephthysia bennettiae]|uniref:Ferredoxin n=1 Tax=Candidatus Nephthysia bennettiae TaxID=3127016 RepID=A0A934K3A6_9BACT|nr:ferredoxin [Candidatus Dormibacteraeota bacterium]MBJ7610721.1 ferredoxin [Candidatus Dormibacteraeota bacterium]PZR85411.1 MAG: ferredoxin [Candidatus Dormibacteraeota bacterium]
MAAAERATGAELTLDRIRCDGRGLCAELLPELVRLDDWGYPIVAPGPIPDHLLGHAKRAVAACPVLALTLRRSQQAPGRFPANSK